MFALNEFYMKGIFFNAETKRSHKGTGQVITESCGAQLFPASESLEQKIPCALVIHQFEKAKPVAGLPFQKLFVSLQRIFLF